MEDQNNNQERFEMRMPEDYGEAHKYHSRLGLILTVLIVVLLLIFGGLYLWGSMLGEQVGFNGNAPLNNEPETPRAVADAQILSTMSPSNELDAIEADLMSTNLDLLDADLAAIDAELTE